VTSYRSGAVLSTSTLGALLGCPHHCFGARRASLFATAKVFGVARDDTDVCWPPSKPRGVFELTSTFGQVRRRRVILGEMEVAPNRTTCRHAQNEVFLSVIVSKSKRVLTTHCALGGDCTASGFMVASNSILNENAVSSMIRSRMLLAASFLFAHGLTGATIINGGNLTTTTWTPAGNPYVVMGDVTVQAGGTLTIDSGVEVRFASADAQATGRDPSRVELTINGILDVNGTAASPVVFKGQMATAGSWYGMVIRSGGLATLDHAFIQHARTGLTCESASGAEVNNVTASTNQTAMLVNAGRVMLNEFHAFANQTAINVGGTGSVSMVRSVIYGNAVQGLQINPSGTFGDILVEHCTMNGNGTYGINIGSASRAPVTIRSTIITGSAYGLYRSVSATGSVDVIYSDVWGNSSNFVNAVAGTEVISADPLYIDADGADNVLGTADDNLRLQPNTPCAYRSHTGQDIGAYENAKLVISPPQFAGENATFRVVSISNRMHQLEFTEDFISWNIAGSNGPGTGAFLYLTNFGVRSLPKRFYRVRLN
jgi:hypothetical protein